MAKPAKRTEATKITRISASDSSSKKPAKAAKATKPVHPQEVTEKRGHRRRNPLGAMGEYLKGSWYELRQVRWPDRRATWGMTGALIAFTLFFVLVIVLLDYGFAELFKLIMGSN